ncbi:hypothetical protein LEMLEM_LOCUS19843 [Lemmus lemmus]
MDKFVSIHPNNRLRPTIKMYGMVRVCKPEIPWHLSVDIAKSQSERKYNYK